MVFTWLLSSLKILIKSILCYSSNTCKGHILFVTVFGINDTKITNDAKIRCAPL